MSEAVNFQFELQAAVEAAAMKNMLAAFGITKTNEELLEIARERLQQDQK